MSEIKKVLYKNLKNSYWLYKNKIYEENYFLNIFPSFLSEVESINAIIKNSDEVVKANYTLSGNYRAFPTANKMIETLENKRKEIYKTLQLEKIDSNFPIAKALVVMYYLANRSFYDMTTMEIALCKLEESRNNYNKNYAYKEQSMKERMKVLNEKHSNDDLSFKEQDELVDLYYKLTQLYTFKEKTINEADNITTLYYLYDTLIYKRGVCANFSYAYKYLLSELNIQVFTLSYIDNKTKIGHALNIIQNFVDLQPVYYVFDITLSNNYKGSAPEIILYTAGADINKRLEGDVEILGLSRIMDLKKDAQYTFLNDIYNKQTWEKIKERIVVKPDLKLDIKIAKEHIEKINKSLKKDSDELEL